MTCRVSLVEPRISLLGDAQALADVDAAAAEKPRATLSSGAGPPRPGSWKRLWSSVSTMSTAASSSRVEQLQRAHHALGGELHLGAAVGHGRPSSSCGP